MYGKFKVLSVQFLSATVVSHLQHKQPRKIIPLPHSRRLNAAGLIRQNQSVIHEFIAVACVWKLRHSLFPDLILPLFQKPESLILQNPAFTGCRTLK